MGKELTDREREIIFYKISGLRNEDVAELLNISIHTVTSTTAYAYLKMDVKNKVGALMVGIERGYWEPEDFLDASELDE